MMVKRCKTFKFHAEMYVADEIITAASGVRIRVNNTDAEGRFAMGDCLFYMKQEVSPCFMERNVVFMIKC